MLRLLLSTVALTLLGPAVTTAWQQESGWISTCAGVGCHGMRSVCYEYRINKVSRYCYRGVDD